jgi:hypothetical protein
MRRVNRAIALLAAIVVSLAVTVRAAAETAIAATSLGVVVAHDGRVELANRWSAEGVENPTHIAVSPDRIAVLDALGDEVAVIELATGRATRFKTAATPIDAAFVGSDLYILARDAAVLQRVGGPSISLRRDPAFLRVAGRRLLVYSRGEGTIEEIVDDRVTRSLAVEPFASDFEIDGTTGYLVEPREARIRVVDLAAMKVTGALSVGAVPVDLALAGGGTAITARILAIADPSSKRIWMTEATQSTAKAVGRGFLRGLLGLGLFGSRSSRFPTGIDRVVIRGHTSIAYDTTNGTLYRFSKKTSSILAKGIGPNDFTILDDRVVWWKDARLFTSSQPAIESDP